MKTRKEYDSIGSVNVPVDKYWGASTQRSSKYFDIGDFLVRPIVIKSIAIIKKAAAIVNAKNGDLDKKISKAIVKAASEVVSGKLDEKSTNKNVKIMNCFDRFKGQNAFEIKRNGMLLSVIRKKINISNWN